MTARAPALVADFTTTLGAFQVYHAEAPDAEGTAHFRIAVSGCFIPPGSVPTSGEAMELLAGEVAARSRRKAENMEAAARRLLKEAEALERGGAAALARFAGRGHDPEDGA
jgi:hypothetical protein